MKPVLALFAAALVICAQLAAQTQAKPLDNAGIIKLKRAGLSDDVIVAAVKAARDVNLDTSTDGLLALKDAGISERVMLAILERQGAESAAARPAAPAPTVETHVPTGPTTAVTLLAGDREISLTSSTVMAGFGPKDARFSEKVKQSGSTVDSDSDVTKAAKKSVYHTATGAILNRVPWGAATGASDTVYGQPASGGGARIGRARQFFFFEQRPVPEVTGRLMFRLPPKYGGIDLDEHEPVLVKLTVFEKERARLIEIREVELKPVLNQPKEAPPEIRTLSSTRQEMPLEMRRDAGVITVTSAALPAGHYALLLKAISGEEYAGKAFEIWAR